MSLKSAIKGTAHTLGINIRRTSTRRSERGIPDHKFYTPLFSPWNGYGEMERYFQLAKPFTMLGNDRLYVLYTMAKNAIHLEGDFWECGVYKGGTARMFAEILEEHAGPDVKLHLFDTFSGMLETSKEFDLHKAGDFSDTSLEAVQQAVGHPERVAFHPGWIPDTFKDIQDRRIAMAHVDVDLYGSVKDCCEFIYPRLAVGAVMVFDDYGFPSCPGARKAVDDYFADKPENPLVLQTGQALVIRMAD
jgi:O-methyltransferase